MVAKPTLLQLDLCPAQLARDYRQVGTEFRLADVDLHQEIAARITGDPLVIADFGCGSGVAIRQIDYMFSEAKTIGIDLNPMPGLVAAYNAQIYRTLGDQIKEGMDVSGFFDLSENCRTKFVSADLANTGLNDNSVDLIYSVATLIYIGDKLKVFEEVYRVLKPGGIAFLSVSAHDIAFGLFGADFLKIMDATKGADKVFVYKAIDDSSGVLICRKSEDDEFEGFPYTLAAVLTRCNKKDSHANHYKCGVYYHNSENIPSNLIEELNNLGLDNSFTVKK